MTMENIPDLKERQDRLKENLKRLGCCLILSPYLELKRWIKPRQDYTTEQLAQLEKEDPLLELHEFFFGQDGMEDIIDTFQIHLDPKKVKAVAKKMLDHARECIEGKEPTTQIPEEAWDLLADTIGKNLDQGDIKTPRESL